MSIFGWSYPAGAANDPFAPYNQTEQPCELCGEFCDTCICPECPTCGAQGDPVCYDKHGLTLSQAQQDSLAKHEAEWDALTAADAAAEAAYADQLEDVPF